MTKLKISLAQINITFADVSTNIEKVFIYINEAKQQQSDIILFPELWSSGYDLKNRDKYINSTNNILDQINTISKTKNIAIGGSIINRQDKNYFNTFFLHTPEQKDPLTYNKIHLIPQMEEDKWFSKGNNIEINRWNDINLGMIICYDLRFPELIRNYVYRGINLLLVVAEWPLSRIDHWKSLLKARAIENQIFIAAVNAVGETNNTLFGGCSCIFDPWGNTMILGDNTHEVLLTSEIDLNDVNRVRKSFPVLNDLRKDLY